MRILAFGLLAALTAAAATPARAQSAPKPTALAALESIAANLGPTTDAASNQSFSIPWPGKYNVTIEFDTATDGSVGYAFVLLASYKPAELARLPYAKLLEQDDKGDYFYSAEPDPNGGERLYANAVIPLAGLTPPLLRGLLTGMAAKITAADSDWNTALWK
jgi:hypothetical protein